jgi:hypothetical protein
MDDVGLQKGQNNHNNIKGGLTRVEENLRGMHRMGDVTGVTPAQQD